MAGEEGTGRWEGFLGTAEGVRKLGRRLVAGVEGQDKGERLGRQLGTTGQGRQKTEALETGTEGRSEEQSPPAGRKGWVCVRGQGAGPGLGAAQAV